MIAQALGIIARSKNFSALARQADMSREGLYKVLVDTFGNMLSR